MQNDPPKPRRNWTRRPSPSRNASSSMRGQGQARELGELLRMGLPPNLRNEKGDSLLMLASYHGHADTVRVLMEHGADPELANDRGQTPLAGAAFKGDMATIVPSGWRSGRRRPQRWRKDAADDCGDVQTAARSSRFCWRGTPILRRATPAGLNTGQLAAAMGAVDTAERLSQA